MGSRYPGDPVVLERSRMTRNWSITAPRGRLMARTSVPTAVDAHGSPEPSQLPSSVVRPEVPVHVHQSRPLRVDAPHLPVLLVLKWFGVAIGEGAVHLTHLNAARHSRR